MNIPFYFIPKKGSAYCMKKIRVLLALLIAFAIIIIGSDSNTFAYAQDDNVIVTHDLVGDNDYIERVHISNKVIEIEDGAFSGLTTLKEIVVDEDNPYYASYDGCLYNKTYTILMCVPQNTTSVKAHENVVMYTEHALDGLPQSRKDKLDEIIKDHKNAGKTVSSPTKTQKGNKVTKYKKTKETKKETKQENTTTDFSQYTYKEGDDICFEYTGTGDSKIIVPEGVTKIVCFSGTTGFKFNYDITYIKLPSTLRVICIANLFAEAEEDTNFYSVLYQCPNLKTVEGGNYSYQCNGSSVTRPGDITVWSTTKRYKYDKQKYQNYNNR
jgi:hypothetical protein